MRENKTKEEKKEGIEGGGIDKGDGFFECRCSSKKSTQQLYANNTFKLEFFSTTEDKLLTETILFLPPKSPSTKHICSSSH